MFQRDDELTKGGGGLRRKTDVVEEARKRRIEREMLRHQERHIILVQSLVRRYLTKQNTRKLLMKIVDERLQDIVTLQGMLEKVFCIPPQVLIPMLRSALFAVKLQNASTLESNSILQLSRVIEHMKSTWILSDENYVAAFGEMPIGLMKQVISICFLMGQQSPSSLSFPESLVVCSKSVSEHQSQAFVKMLTHDNLRIITSKWYDPTWKQFSMLMRDEILKYGDINPSWWSILFTLVQKSTDKQNIVQQILKNVLTIPGLQVPILWQQQIHTLWKAIVSSPLNEAELATSPIVGIPSTLFILANLLDLRPKEIDSSTLVLELQFLRNLLLLVPNESYSAEPLAWHHVSKNHSVPVVYPSKVVLQLRHVYHYDTVRDWCERCFKVNHDGLVNPLTTKEVIPMFPTSGTEEEKYGFGYIAQQGGSFSILRKFWKKTPQWSSMFQKLNPFKSSAPRKAKEIPSSKRISTIKPFDTQLVLALSHFYGTFMYKWKPNSKKNTPEMLSLLSFYRKSNGESLISILWLFLQEMYDIDAYAKEINLDDCALTDPIASLILLFALLYCNLLLVLDDIEMYDRRYPLPFYEVERVVVFFKQLLYRKYWINKKIENAESYGNYITESATKLLQALYNRCSRRPFCNITSWIVKDLNGDDLLDSILNQDPRGMQLMAHMPYLLPFADRVRLYEALLKIERERNQQGTPLRITIRRGYELEDGFTRLNVIRRDLKKRIQVHFINEAGLEEVGIDAGGLFKEFWTLLSQQAFDPNYGLFQSTEDQLMYPNPNSCAIHSNDTLLFEFLGRILGKALYENIIVQPKFARFFLTKLLGNNNQMNDLPSLDIKLYENLLFLKHYDGNVLDLGLTFTIGHDCFGIHSEIDLLPGGSSISVTNENRFRYIHLAANYYLNIQIKQQSIAFLNGLRDVMDFHLLEMFNEPELQVLVSGTSCDFNIDDLKSATIYNGGYFSNDKRILWLWKALESFTSNERNLFLKFVTSCQRPPILGFHSLYPPFTIQKIFINNNDEKLPTASTCFNTLKLPTYTNYNILRQKLIISIYSGAGFEMT